MSLTEKEWLALAEASERLGVHPSTLRRWADDGRIPCFRTPGGHRRFRGSELAAWIMKQRESSLIIPPLDFALQKVIRFTQQEMTTQLVSGEPWYVAFNQEQARQQMRDSGRRLLGLALQYLSRTREREPILREGRRIGEFFGEQCGRWGISLVDTVRGFFFFREAFLRAMRPGLINTGQYDEEDVRIHRELRQFLDEAMYACLAQYDRARYARAESVSKT